MSAAMFLLAAVDRLIWRGHYEPVDDDPDDVEFQAAVASVWFTHPDVRTPDELADWWEYEAQVAWERSLPEWVCLCGARYKVLPGDPHGDDHFYRCLADGCVGDLVGSNRGVGLASSRSCVCGRGFVGTVRQQLKPQMRLFEE